MQVINPEVGSQRRMLLSVRPIDAVSLLTSTGVRERIQI